MSGLNLHIKFEDFGASIAMQSLAASFSDLTPLMDELGAEIEASTVERFQTNVSPQGNPWLPSLRVQRAQGAALTLVESGHLRDSITRESGSRFTRVGSNVVYAAIHQSGGKAGRNKKVDIPSRAYLGVSEADDRSLMSIVADYHRDALGGAVQ